MDTTPQNKWMLRVVGFSAVLAAAFVIEALIFIVADEAGYRIIPKGLTWFAAPVLIAILGARWAENNGERLAGVIKRAALATPTRRLFLALTSCWVLGVIAVMFLFNPLGRYWNSADWDFFWKLLLAPPVLLGVFIFICKKFHILKLLDS